MTRLRIAAIAAAIGCAGCGPRGGGPVAVPPAHELAQPEPGDPHARGAAYLAAVAAVLQPRWRQFLEDCRTRLPAAHPLNAPALAATYELAIGRDGALAARHAAEPSGNGDYDTAIADVLGDAAPLPAPPADLASDDDLVHVRWLFARDRRQAGAATARVEQVELPLLAVVTGLAERGDLARAARRTAAAAATDPDRMAAASRVMIAALAEALASPNSAARRAAADAVARARTTELAAGVRALLRPTGDVDLQLAAIAAVAALDDRAAAPVLVAGLAADLADDPPDASPHARLALARARALVALHGGDGAAAVLRDALEPSTTTSPAGTPGAPGSVAGPATTTSPAGTAAPAAHRGPSVVAIAALGIAPVPALAAKLAPWFARGDAKVRAAVCTALPNAAPAAAESTIARGLRDADATVRAACADAAGREPPVRAPVAKLRELARDRDRLVRASAVAALGVLDALRAAAPHSALRGIDDPAPEVRRAGVPFAGAAEQRALALDADPDVRAAAVAALGDRDVAARAATDPAPQVRRAAAALVADDDSLARLAADDSPEVATAALVRLAGRRGRAAVANPLLERLAAAPAGSAERTRIALAWLLAR